MKTKNLNDKNCNNNCHKESHFRENYILNNIKKAKQNIWNNIHQLSVISCLDLFGLIYKDNFYNV